MADTFQIDFCFGESDCGDTLQVTDNTGIFSIDNPLGYNAPDIVVPTLDVDTGEFGYASYQLQLWFAQTGGIDTTTTPDFTANLLTTTHTTDTTTGYVTWDFSLETLGLPSLMSGWWYGRVVAVWVDSDDVSHTYTSTAMMFLVGQMTKLVDEAMLKSDPNCSCAEGCITAQDLFLKLQMAERQACLTYVEAAQANMDWLYYNTPLCQC